MERTLLKLALAISLGMAFGKNNDGKKKKKKHKKGEPDIILIVIDQSFGSFLLYFKGGLKCLIIHAKTVYHLSDIVLVGINAKNIRKLKLWTRKKRNEKMTRQHISKIKNYATYENMGGSNER